MARSESSFKIILGSSSRARKEILAEMGYEFTIIAADIDEKSIRKEKPEDLVMALAEAKADAIISRFQGTDQFEEDDQPKLLITADTVYFYEIPDEVIDSLIEEGIPFKVAGGLMLEHPLTLPFVESLVGTPDTVMGLPKALTEELIQEALYSSPD